jgi:PPP family 3-phenylpropionic acid transporter
MVARPYPGVRGSHSLHDGFEVIRWRAAGMSAGQISILWSLSVAAEVAVFAGFGPRLLELLGPRRAMVLSACAGVIRWGTAARTAWFPAMAIVEPLHGLTFAMLHLACMGMIARVIPPRLAATAQALYATVAMGATAALVTAVSGPLYGTFGAASFWTMALMCALSVPLALTIKSNDGIFDAQS